MKRHKFPEWFQKAWPEERLNNMRHSGDALADQTVAAILAVGDRTLVNTVMASLHEPAGWPAQTPPELATYLAMSQQLPSWADKDALARAYRFMALHEVYYSIILLFLSLPILNGWKVGGAQTLALTGELEQRFARRLSETFQFVRAVIAEQGMSAKGNGIRTTQKVRLMHATIRHFALKAGYAEGKPYWQSDWGQPINQEALTATMLTFSTLATDGLRKLDIPVSPQEEADLLHLWKVIGHVLGINDANMPGSVEEAQHLWQKCVERNFGHNAAGVMLTKAHISFLRNLVKDDALLDGALRSTDEALLRYLIGYRISVTILGIPRPGWFGRFVLWFRSLFGLNEIIVEMDKPLQRWLEDHAAAIMLKLQAFWDHLDQSRPFHMPSKEEAEAGLTRTLERCSAPVPSPLQGEG